MVEVTFEQMKRRSRHLVTWGAVIQEGQTGGGGTSEEEAEAQMGNVLPPAIGQGGAIAVGTQSMPCPDPLGCYL